MKVRVADRLWTIRYVSPRELGVHADADCDHPPGRHPTIRIRRTLKGCRLLDATIHELLHASRPELDEEAVNKTAAEVARALWKIGWRLVDSS